MLPPLAHGLGRLLYSRKGAPDTNPCWVGASRTAWKRSELASQIARTCSMGPLVQRTSGDSARLAKLGEASRGAPHARHHANRAAWAMQAVGSLNLLG